MGGRARLRRSRGGGARLRQRSDSGDAAMVGKDSGWGCWCGRRRGSLAQVRLGWRRGAVEWSDVVVGRPDSGLGARRPEGRCRL